METVWTADRSAVLASLLGKGGARRLFAVGDLGILRRPALGLLCSAACPGELALRAHDLASRLARYGPAVVSGFHSPVESECLHVLLGGSHPVIWCLARQLDPRHLDGSYLAEAAAGRLLLLSPFGPPAGRSTAGRARVRNLLVASLAGSLLVVHAQPGGGVERCCRSARAGGKLLLTFDAAANAGLLALGARALAEKGV